MAITVKDKIFNLETENTLYQMKVDRFGVLNHLWYGEKTDCCMDYLLDYPDAGFSGNIYEAENERTYSLNTLPQEYSTSGVGDFRISAISVTHEDGSNALDLRVREYQIKKGKYEIPGPIIIMNVSLWSFWKPWNINCRSFPPMKAASPIW